MELVGDVIGVVDSFISHFYKGIDMKENNITMRKMDGSPCFSTFFCLCKAFKFVRTQFGF